MLHHPALLFERAPHEADPSRGGPDIAFELFEYDRGSERM
jgi:hypothetical protein